MTLEERADKAFGEYKGWNELDYYTDGYIQGATDQQKIDIERVKDVMNRLMIDTKDKADIIKAIEV